MGIFDKFKNNAFNYNDKGIKFANLKKYQKALEYFNLAIELEPERFEAWNNKAKALLNLNNYPEALECFDRTLKLDPKMQMLCLERG